MGYWISLWSGILTVGLFLFAALAMVVTLGAFFDIRSMFGRIRFQHASQGGAGKSQAPSGREAASPNVPS